MQTKILNFIKNQNVPAYELCDALKWNRNKISDVKNGRSRFSVDDVLDIAQFFGVSIDLVLDYKPAKNSLNSFNTVNNNNNSHILIGAEKIVGAPLGDVETEILSLCSKIDMKTKTKLLMFAYKLVEGDADEK